jgi:hypothetical protein
MTDTIDFGTCVHTFNDYSIYVLNDIYKFLKNVKIWKGLRTKNGKYSVDNREVDDTKVNEIYECILNLGIENLYAKRNFLSYPN